MDPMPGFDIRRVFKLPPRDSTLQYKSCIHLWNNFPCITTLVNMIFMISFSPGTVWELCGESSANLDFQGNFSHQQKKYNFEFVK